MIVIVEVWIPSIDLDEKRSIRLSRSLMANKAVSEKKVNTGNVRNVAETRIFFGIEVKRFEDVWTIAYSALSAAWKEACDTDLRIMRMTFHQPGIEWTKPQEVDDGSVR